MKYILFIFLILSLSANGQELPDFKFTRPNSFEWGLISSDTTWGVIVLKRDLDFKSSCVPFQQGYIVQEKYSRTLFGAGPGLTLASQTEWKTVTGKIMLLTGEEISLYSEYAFFKTGKIKQ